MGAVRAGARGVAVVVLAAGHGRRLGDAAGPGPKWLIEVGGAPIAERHLRAIEETLGPDTEVIVVVGHAADRVERYCQGRAQRSSLRPCLVVNEQHAERNNWYSLLVGLDALEGRVGADDVVIVLNSDLFASSRWIGAMLATAAALDEAPGLLAVDVVRPLTPEAMKVAAGAGDADRRRWCTAIGKVGVSDPIGEYVGISALAASGRVIVGDALRGFLGQANRANAWYEDAYQQVSVESPFLVVCPTPSSDWVEIDDGDDLALANRLAANVLTPRATENGEALGHPARPMPHSREP